jgi:DNA-binding transcriptional ArsR family regulator
MDTKETQIMDEESSAFVKLLGNSPSIKVLDFLLLSKDFDYSKKEIAENSKISYNTLNAIWPYLIQNEILKKTRKLGKQEMFKLNAETLQVKLLLGLYNSLIYGILEEQSKRNTLTAKQA